MKEYSRATYICEVCKKTRSVHNRKRHGALHYHCQLCYSTHGPRHKCLPQANLQWISLHDTNGKLLYYILGVPVNNDAQADQAK